MGVSSKLYTPALLALATGLAAFPLSDDLPFRAEGRSRSCGSVVMLGLALDEKGRIERIGMQVTACAIGQASAMLLGQSIRGTNPGDVVTIANGIAAWLAGEGALPRWPAIEALIPARDHPGRHGALILPWTTAVSALSSICPAR